MIPTRTAVILIGVSLILPVLSVVSPTASMAYSDGVLGNCLIGTWDLREGNTIIQIINPVKVNIKQVMVYFYDDNEKLIFKTENAMSPNDLWEIDCSTLGLKAKFGVVKAVVTPSAIVTAAPPPTGIVGFQIKITGKGTTESALIQVPYSLCGFAE